MKIVDQTVKQGRETTLNDIPVGQVFRGTVFGKNSKQWTAGIFFKAEGLSELGDVLVVQLDSAGSPYANGWIMCGPVEDYAPLDVELVMKGVL